jgi:hypothetical protein
MPSPNLPVLREKIRQAIEEHGFARFDANYYTVLRKDAVEWDTDRNSDFQPFLAAAKTAGVKLITCWENELTELELAGAEAILDTADLPAEEDRELRRMLAGVRSHVGDLSCVGIGFTIDRIPYQFEVEPLWYREYMDEMEIVRMAATGPDWLDEDPDDEDDDEDDDDGPFSPGGRYFSNN